MDIKQFLFDYVQENIGQTDGKVVACTIVDGSPAVGDIFFPFDYKYLYCGYVSIAPVNNLAVDGLLEVLIDVNNNGNQLKTFVGYLKNFAGFEDTNTNQILILGNQLMYTATTNNAETRINFIGYRIKIS